MSLEQDFNQFALDSRQFQGKVLAWMDGTGDHIKAVSHKADAIRAELTTHKDSADAHGAGAATKTASSLLGWCGLGLSLFTFLVVIYKLGMGR